jgi:hypothetical protein
MGFGLEVALVDRFFSILEMFARVGQTGPLGGPAAQKI